jgi:lysophospholipase L1-like esterase
VRRWIWVTVALVVAAAAGIGAYVVYRHHEEANSLTSTNAAQCKAADAEGRGMTGPFTFGKMRVDVLGDSYAVGTTLPDPQHQAWDVLLAEREHWNLTVRGIGRTGFVNGGYCGNQSYPTRVQQVLADRPQLIIVEGGNNDAGQSGIGAAARAILAKIPASVRVVVVGPTDAPGREASDQRNTNRALATAAGKRYISALDWKLDYGPDKIHMTPKGNRQLAAHLAAALPSAG